MGAIWFCFQKQNILFALLRKNRLASHFLCRVIGQITKKMISEDFDYYLKDWSLHSFEFPLISGSLESGGLQTGDVFTAFPQQRYSKVGEAGS